MVTGTCRATRNRTCRRNARRGGCRRPSPGCRSRISSICPRRSSARQEHRAAGLHHRHRRLSSVGDLCAGRARPVLRQPSRRPGPRDRRRQPDRPGGHHPVTLDLCGHLAQGCRLGGDCDDGPGRVDPGGVAASLGGALRRPARPASVAHLDGELHRPEGRGDLHRDGAAAHRGPDLDRGGRRRTAPAASRRRRDIKGGRYVSGVVVLSVQGLLVG